MVGDPRRASIGGCNVSAASDDLQFVVPNLARGFHAKIKGLGGNEMGTIQIEIPNWPKFNPRADRANYSWFRLENDFFADQRVFMLSGDEQRLYLFVLCEASKKNEGTINLVPQYIAALLRTTEASVTAGLLALNSSGLLIADITPPICRQDAVTEPTKSLTTNETNVTYETNERPVFDFEILYEQFPKRADGNNSKAQGIKKCKTRVKSQKQYDRLALAVKNYAKLKSGDPFSKSWNNWMEEWEDWVDPPAVKTGRPTQPFGPQPPPPTLTVPDADLTRNYLEKREADFKSATPVDPAKVRELVRRVTGNLG